MKKTARPLRENGEHSRFVNWNKSEPDKVISLADDHPAVVEGRTMFPTRRAPPTGPRMLISGHNSPKTGRIVTRGPWQSFPIYTLTLEERATCPRSCDQWKSCFGSGMPWPKRWDHRHPDFLDNLRSEIIMKAREHPGGLVVRLHVLGDFFSVAYVRLWADMIDRFPNLKVFGYTHRREDADDEESRKIALALRYMTENAWDQFAIRFSHPVAGPQRAVVYTEQPDDPGVIMCPQQIDKTASCGTCALCWAEPSKDKTIGFLMHGHQGGPRTEKAADMARPLKIPETARKAVAMRQPETVHGVEPAPIERIRFSTCQWPSGCPRSVFKRSYCEEHYAVAHNKPFDSAKGLAHRLRRYE